MYLFISFAQTELIEMVPRNDQYPDGLSRLNNVVSLVAASQDCCLAHGLFDGRQRFVVCCISETGLWYRLVTRIETTQSVISRSSEFNSCSNPFFLMF